MNKGCLVGLSAVLLVFSGLCLCLWNFARIKSYGVGVDTVRIGWLPDEISDVTYISGNINRIAEFSIDQKAFENWCESAGKPLSPVADNSKPWVFRANEQLERIGKIERPSDPDRLASWRSKTLEPEDLFYKDRWDNGGGFSIGYDVSTRRGYFEYASH
ncbi:MAG: hypothetical protein P1U86_17660 [Verrucomicrobiales bacterium]|nr:hypothetical protein [Verrucomicrobiales bacterium]